MQVDKTVGCSSELLAIIASITDVSRQLVRKPNCSIMKRFWQYLKADSQESDSPELQDRIITIETQLDNLIQILPEPGAIWLESLVLARTSTLIQNAAKIYFYTSLHSALPSTHIVRRLVTEQVLLLQSMSCMQSAHLWSIFVTALYAHEDGERMFFLEQFDKLEIASATRSSMHNARAIVQTVWKKRDLDADSDQSLQPDTSDWVKYVRPMSEGLSLAWSYHRGFMRNRCIDIRRLQPKSKYLYFLEGHTIHVSYSVSNRSLPFSD